MKWKSAVASCILAISSCRWTPEWLMNLLGRLALRVVDFKQDTTPPRP